MTMGKCALLLSDVEYFYSKNSDKPQDLHDFFQLYLMISCDGYYGAFLKKVVCFVLLYALIQ